jgi:hypothetical protein
VTLYLHCQNSPCWQQTTARVYFKGAQSWQKYIKITRENVCHMYSARGKSFWNWYSSQGRIQILGWGGGGVCRRGVWGPKRSPAGPRQSPGRGPRGLSPPEALGVWGITNIYLNDNFEPTTPFLSDQKNLTLSLNFVG